MKRPSLKVADIVRAAGQQFIYSPLLRLSAETPIEVARNPKHLGAEIGFFSVLHTWTQTHLIYVAVRCWPLRAMATPTQIFLTMRS